MRIARIRFCLLGEATVADETGAVRVSATKGLALLCYLAMNRGRPVHRADLATLLWGDRTDAQARQNLRQSILTLRRDLGPALAPLLQTDDQSVALVVDPADVDALQFAAWAEAADPAEQQRCLDLPWGPFLGRFSGGAEAFDEWIASERGRLEAIATRAFSELADRFDAAGDGERAIRALERLVAIDPAEEARHRRLLSLEARHRGTDAALARAKSLAALLKREFDAEPEPATLVLIEELRQAGAAPDTDVVRREAKRLQNGAAASISTAAASPSAAPPRRWTHAAMLTASAAAVVLVAGAILVMNAMRVPPVRDGVTQARARVDADPSWRSPSMTSGVADAVGRSNGSVAVAVLPFTSLGEHTEAPSLLAAMMTDDLTHVLSRIDMFRVISAQTAASYAGQRIDAAAIGAELGIRYLLEGSVSLRGDVARVNVSLVDVKTRLHIWSSRFERAGADRHAIQDEIVNGLARELQFEIGQIESTPSAKEPDVHALVFKGWQAIHAAARSGLDPLRNAENLLQEALRRDPDNARAQHGLAQYHTLMAVQLYGDDPAAHLAKAQAILEPLIDRHPNMSGPHATMGLLLIARQQSRKAARPFQRALALNPSDAGSHAQLGRILVRTGRPQEGLEHILYAMRLSPRDPMLSYWLAFAGVAELELTHFNSAIDYLDRALAMNPGHPRTVVALVAAQALAGKMDDARRKLQDLRRALPHLSNEALLQRFDRASPDTKFHVGLRLALAASPSD